MGVATGFVVDSESGLDAEGGSDVVSRGVVGSIVAVAVMMVWVRVVCGTASRDSEVQPARVSRLTVTIVPMKRVVLIFNSNACCR